MYYHASSLGNITKLEPRVSNHNTPLIYFSTKRENVLVYLSNAIEKHCKESGFIHNGRWHKWASYGFDPDGILVLDEYYPNATEDTYKGVSGYIYYADKLPEEQFDIGINFTAASSLPVQVSGCEYIEDAYSEIMKAVDLGLIKLRKYEDMSDKMLLWIESTIKNEYTNAEHNPDYRYFLESKFGFLKKTENSMDNTKKFDSIANEYAKSRPGYSAELIDCMYKNYGLSASSRIADIGSGTGKFAKQLLEKGSTVFCVEPNTDMRLTAEAELQSYKNFVSINATADNTKLSAESVDFITTAQAFHWFDVNSFKKECQRIIKPSGKVFLIWNSRVQESDVNKELYRIYSQFCPAFNGFSGGIKPHDNRIKEFFNNSYEFITFDNPLYFDRQKFLLRSLSASYSLHEGDRDFDRYSEEINKVFDSFSVNGSVKTENQTVCYIGSIK